LFEFCRGRKKKVPDTFLTPNEAEAGTLLGIDQPKVSRLLAGKVSGYSMDRLMKFLTALDHDVTIQIKKKPRSHETACMGVAYA